MPRNFSNAGLALYRYLPITGDDHGSAKKLLDPLTLSEPSDIYKSAFGRWKSAAGADPGALTIELKLVSLLAVGLGEDSPLEVGLRIHHTYGMPIIPGSAIKGVCRMAAIENGMKEKTPEFEILFGDTDRPGQVIFHDAWFVPDSVKNPFHQDVVTVHHPGYYQQQGAEWPTDFDDPVPLPFLAVSPGAKFLFRVDCPGDDWKAYVGGLLPYTLSEIGIGGKTNAGYGRFEATASVLTDGVQSSASAEVVIEKWERVFVKLDKGKQIINAIDPANRRKKATMDAPVTGKLLAALSEDQRRMIEKGGMMSIECEKFGNSWKIIRVLP
jgi:CRISPR-associated protein Cmr6